MTELVSCRVRDVTFRLEVQRDAPLAIYTHCAGHRLNLVISHSCSVAEIRYMIDKVKSCYFFLGQ